MKHITTPNASATQTEHPNRATVRSFVQAWFVPTVLILLAAPTLFETAFTVVEENGGQVPPELVAAAAGITTTIAVISAVVTKIMAIPGVESALRKSKLFSWLSAAPLEAVDTSVDTQH